jgi:hypothetical protein
MGSEPFTSQYAIPFVWNNTNYYHPSGDANFPFDMVSGYTMSTIESNIITHAYGMSSVSDYCKANKPAGVTDKHIDVLFKLYNEKF